MGDAETQIGSHWTVVTSVVAAVAGAIVGIFFFTRALMNALDNRSDERHRLFWSNGGGELLTGRVKAGVLEALAEHQVSCPHSLRVESLEDRVVTLERAK